MAESSPLLEIRGLTHRFSDGTEGIRDVSFTVREGSFLIISGPNGSGKSVLMKHLNGLLEPTAGEVLLRGESVNSDLTSARRSIGLVFQDADSQIIGQTVERDTAFGPENLRMLSDEVNSRVEKALNTVDLLEKRRSRPHTLSGGEKRRLAVAGVLAMDSRILIFDEPFSNLDYPAVKNVLRSIVSLHDQGHTIIVITHDVEKLLAHASEMIIMNRGRIVESGRPRDLLESLEKWGIRRPPGLQAEEMTWLK